MFLDSDAILATIEVQGCISKALSTNDLNMDFLFNSASIFGLNQETQKHHIIQESQETELSKEAPDKGADNSLEMKQIHRSASSLAIKTPNTSKDDQSKTSRMTRRRRSLSHGSLPNKKPLMPLVKEKSPIDVFTITEILYESSLKFLREPTDMWFQRGNSYLWPHFAAGFLKKKKKRICILFLLFLGLIIEKKRKQQID